MKGEYTMNYVLVENIRNGDQFEELINAPDLTSAINEAVSVLQHLTAYDLKRRESARLYELNETDYEDVINGNTDLWYGDLAVSDWNILALLNPRYMIIDNSGRYWLDNGVGYEEAEAYLGDLYGAESVTEDDEPEIVMLAVTE